MNEWPVLPSSSFSQLPSLHLGGSVDAEWGANIQKAQWKRGVSKSIAWSMELENQLHNNEELTDLPKGLRI